MIKQNLFIAIFVVVILLIGCNNPGQNQTEQSQSMDSEMNGYPAAEGFNETASDQEAIEVANEVMESMGGYQNWVGTHYLSWNFFGARKHYWNKWTNDIRVESLRDDLVILMNIDSRNGKVQKNGEHLTNSDSVSKYLDMGWRWWVNDSYWLAMPFKLKDSGVTLKYLGEDTTQSGDPAHKLQLTFAEVGHTPQNKYHVFVNKERDLVTQWSFFRSADQEEPNFTTPWEGYQEFGNILLAGGRGEREISEIMVSQDLPDMVFISFDEVALD